jgi:hypothetical protein
MMGKRDCVILWFVNIFSRSPVFLSVKSKSKSKSANREPDLLWAGFALDGCPTTFWGPLKGQLMWTFAYNAYAQMHDPVQCTLLVQELELLWYRQTTAAVAKKEASLLNNAAVKTIRIQRRAAMVACLQDLAQRPEGADDAARISFWYTLITQTGYRGMAHGEFAKDGLGKLLVTPAGLAQVCA